MSISRLPTLVVALWMSVAGSSGNPILPGWYADPEARIFDHEYWIYVPDNYDPNIGHALVVWLHPASPPVVLWMQPAAVSVPFDARSKRVIARSVKELVYRLRPSALTVRP